MKREREEEVRGGHGDGVKEKKREKTLFVWWVSNKREMGYFY